MTKSEMLAALRFWLTIASTEQLHRIVVAVSKEMDL